MWHYEPVNSGNIAFSVWRKIDVNRYKVVGTNRIVVKGNDNMAILFSLCSVNRGRRIFDDMVFICSLRTSYFR